MKNYHRLMLGAKSIYAAECLAGGFVGVNFEIHQDLTGQLPDEWREFNKKFIPVFLEARPEKTKIAAGLACGALWTVAKGMQLGDILLCPDGSGQYHLGQVSGPYEYKENEILPHRRAVQWLNKSIDRSDMSDALKGSCGSALTVSNLTRHSMEIDKLMAGIITPEPGGEDSTVEDPSAFALEKHLEDFLVTNWSSTELSHEYDIFQDNGDIIGQQYPTDTGPIDILAVSKDGKRLLVIELKKGRASDRVVGQIARYMGYVKEELAENGQTVEGVIIALEDDKRVRWALSVVPNVKFYRYQVSFKLVGS
ncbi:DUF1016 family protein [Puniceicoccales bacterium CK1056]|uniref:DUF1016 family protein n=1 Tax=Oceanipulchritudo coccoides TaxID=2706888 RepID=A0A6B2M4X6_9BACT|nr:endonuclease NucS domain-containing protein [Oceanipulchritudo coccoides]NDV63137.1 DUF1016 family protein [Oceanipulchritudo coccoides]